MREGRSTTSSRALLGVVALLASWTQTPVAARAEALPRAESWSADANHTSGPWLSLEAAAGVAVTTLPSGVVQARQVVGFGFLARGRINLGHTFFIPVDFEVRSFGGSPTRGTWQTYSMADVFLGTGLAVTPIKTTTLQLSTSLRGGLNVLRSTATTPELYEWGGPGTFVAAELALKLYPLPYLQSLELGARLTGELIFTPKPDASSPEWVGEWTQSTRFATALVFGVGWHF